MLWKQRVVLLDHACICFLLGSWDRDGHRDVSEHGSGGEGSIWASWCGSWWRWLLCLLRWCWLVDRLVQIVRPSARALSLRTEATICVSWTSFMVGLCLPSATRCNKAPSTTAYRLLLKSIPRSIIVHEVSFLRRWNIWLARDSLLGLLIGL